MISPTCCFAPRHQYQQRINLSGAKAGREAEREEGVCKNRTLPSPSLSVSLQMPTAPPPMSLSRSWGCSEPQFLSLESPQPSGQCHTHQKHLIEHLHKLSRPKPLSPFLVSLLHAPAHRWVPTWVMQTLSSGRGRVLSREHVFVVLSSGPQPCMWPFASPSQLPAILHNSCFKPCQAHISPPPGFTLRTSFS